MNTTSQARSPRFVLTEGTTPTTPHLACPVCGDPCVHLGPVSITQGDSTTLVDAEESRVVNRGAKGQARGSEVCVGFWCESGHAFRYVLAFHKGNIEVELLTRDYEGCPPELWRD